MNKEQQRILEQWKMGYKRVQLSFWLLLVLIDGPKDATIVAQSIEEMTDFELSYNIVSIYRVLRRLRTAGFVEMVIIRHNNIPASKIYHLSSTGLIAVKQLQNSYIGKGFTWNK